MTDAPLTTARILRLHVQRLLARFERSWNRALVVLGSLVLYLAATDPSWALLLGRWGGVATILVGFIASEIRKGREASAP